MKTTDFEEEALKYTIGVTSGLDTFRMVVLALATTSTYTVVVAGSEWGRYTSKIKREE